MALSAAEKDEVIEFVRSKGCEEWRRGQFCLDRSDRTRPIPLTQPHPGCTRADEIIAIVRRA